jgi:hypothetical protein
MRKLAASGVGYLLLDVPRAKALVLAFLERAAR